MNDEVVHNDTDGAQSEPNQAQQDTQSQVSAGAHLRTLREARGWTIEQVASQLNLAPRQINALETDNFAALPGLVIVRGFIRTYAKLLRVDAAPILAAIEPPVAAASVLPERAPLSASFSETSVPFGKRRSPSALVIVAALAVLCGALFFVARSAGWIPSSAELTSAASENAISKELPLESSSFVEPTPQEQTFADPPVAAQGAEATTTDSIAPAAVAAQSSAATPSDAAAVADGRNKMVFQVKEDSWVEIKLADNSILVSRVFKAGSTESFDIPGPVSMVIGNAAGVSVTLRGEPLNISGSNSNVARLNVK